MSLLPGRRISLDHEPDGVDPDRYVAVYDKATETLLIRGEVDETDTDQLRDDLRFVSELYSDSLTIDLNGVTFFPSRAIGAIIGAQKAAVARGAEIRLRTGRSTIAAKVLNIAGIPYEPA